METFQKRKKKRKEYYENYGLPKTWDFWEKIDREFILWCDELWVIKLDGWKESTGVNAEIIIALEMGKTIKSVDVHRLSF